MANAQEVVFLNNRTRSCRQLSRGLFRVHQGRGHFFGDVNVHHQHWLGFLKTPRSGEDVRSICEDRGIRPYRVGTTHIAGNPFDLLFTELTKGIHVNKEARVTDHHMLSVL